MAAESLEQHAAKKGISIKVETNGQSGIKHALTAEEIEGAEGIIVAADKYVPMNRFKGKRVVIVKVADGINKADALLDEALSGKVPILKGRPAEVKPQRKKPQKAVPVRSISTLWTAFPICCPLSLAGASSSPLPSLLI